MQHLIFSIFCPALLILIPIPLQASHLTRRGLAIVDSPSGDYEPVRISCPNGPALRFSETGRSRLSDAERTYVSEKVEKSIQPWREYLERAKLEEFNLDQFMAEAAKSHELNGNALPNLGFAFSGGGVRALCFSAAIVEAFDGRNEKAVEAGVGGLIQLATYASSLSGGSWALGSWATADFPRMPVLNQTLWKLTEQNDLWDWNIVKEYPDVLKVIEEKEHAGFPITFVDAWGRLVARHFINDKNEGKGVLWSSIRQTCGYKNREYPFIIVVSVSRPGPHQPVTIQSPIYEYTAEDFTVWNPRLNASIPIQYMGSPSPFSHNKRQGTCVEGYDNAGFIMGMSSNILTLADGPRAKRGFFSKILSKMTPDVSFEGKVPNTFQGLGAAPAAQFPDTNNKNILMADGGSASENIPLFPLLQPDRKIDVIIAVDSTAEEKDPQTLKPVAYPNGTSLYMTYQKTRLPEYNGYHFPIIPNTLDGTFSNLGYNKRPTFFGCQDKPPTPLIIYLPNYSAVAKTDSQTSKTTYEPDLIGEFFENGFAIATQTEGLTHDPEWPTCLACAIIDRQLIRNGTPRTSQCNRCFQRYCAVP